MLLNLRQTVKKRFYLGIKRISFLVQRMTLNFII